MGQEPDNRHVSLRAGGGHGGEHVAVLVQRDIFQTKRQQFIP